jgi:predicted lysophospholipase L1 biosynthesis ABC-type transport system permease subunit
MALNKSVKYIINKKMWLADIGIAIGPVIGYIFQLHLIRTTKSVGTFSIDICAILLISGILRIYFWF